MLRVSSQDGGSRLENLKNTLTNIPIGNNGNIFVNVVSGITKIIDIGIIEHMYRCVSMKFDARFP